MRHGWNEELEKRLHRQRPDLAHMVEVAVVGATDIKKRSDDWIGMDGNFTGFKVRPDGRLELTGADVTLVESTTGSSVSTGHLRNPLTTDLEIEPTNIAVFDIADADLLSGFNKVTAHLVDQVNAGAAKEVASYKMQLFSMVRGEPLMSATAGLIADLVPISQPVEVTAAGGTVGINYEFNLPARVIPIEDRQGTGNTGLRDATAATVVVAIWALRADGTPADNVSWTRDTGIQSVSSGPNFLVHYHLTARFERGENAGKFQIEQQSSVLRTSIVKDGYTATVLPFTEVGNRLDLGAPPTGDLYLVGIGEERSNSSLKYEVRVPGGATWYEYRDGDVIGEDNTGHGGFDLTALPVWQDYDLRITFTPSSPVANVTPVLLEAGVRELTAYDFSSTASVAGVGWRVDPVSCVGEMSEGAITVVKDGPDDSADALSEILSENSIDDIEVSLYVGAGDLDRRHWMLMERFYLEDYFSNGPEIQLSVLGANARLTESIPQFDPATQERTPLPIEGQTLKAAAEIILTEMGVPNRFLGEGIGDEVHTVTKIISDVERGFDELQALAFLAGGAYISSQGHIKFKDLFGQLVPIDEPLTLEEAQATSVTPGWRSAIPEYYFELSYSEEEREYQQEVRATSGPGLLLQRRIDPPERPEERASRYVYDATWATEIARRMVKHFGTGLIHLRYTSKTPRPYLEPGDVLPVEIKDFVARDPLTGRALRGRLWARAVVIEVNDAWGKELVLWIRSYHDFISTEVIGLPSILPKVEIIGMHFRDAGLLDPATILDVDFKVSLGTESLELTLTPKPDGTGGSVTWVIDVVPGQVNSYKIDAAPTDGIIGPPGIAHDGTLYTLDAVPFSEDNGAGFTGSRLSRTIAAPGDIPEPNTDYQAANKLYVDNAVANATGGAVDHGTLTGRGDDDHPQYVHVSVDRTITAQHTFAPAVAQPPFILGANAQGQLVTGLNADFLDGVHSSAFAGSGHGHDLTDANITGILAKAKGGTGANIASTAAGVIINSGATLDLTQPPDTTQRALTYASGSPVWKPISEFAAGTFNGLEDTAFTSLLTGHVAVYDAAYPGGARWKNLSVVDAADGAFSLSGHDHDGAYAPFSHTHPQSDITNLQSDLGLKANLAGANFSGAVLLTYLEPRFTLRGGTASTNTAMIAVGETDTADLKLVYRGDGLAYWGMGVLDAAKLPTHIGFRQQYQSSVIHFYATPQVNGSNVWHAGNFTPSAYEPVIATLEVSRGGTGADLSAGTAGHIMYYTGAVMALTAPVYTIDEVFGPAPGSDSVPMYDAGTSQYRWEPLSSVQAASLGGLEDTMIGSPNPQADGDLLVWKTDAAGLGNHRWLNMSRLEAGVADRNHSHTIYARHGSTETISGAWNFTTVPTINGVGVSAQDHHHDSVYAPLSHASSTANPHSVTKAQVGLGSVENTALSTWAGSTNITTLGTIATGNIPAERITSGVLGRDRVELQKITRADGVPIGPQDFLQSAAWRFAVPADAGNPPGTTIWVTALLTVQGWSSHNAAYPTHQLSFRGGTLGLRHSASTTTWNPWVTIATQEWVSVNYFAQSGVKDVSATNRWRFGNSTGTVETISGSTAALEVYSSHGAGTDAYMAFHVGGDYAAYFGLAGDINDFVVGGWSMGAVRNRVWHGGNFDPATKANTASPTFSGTVNFAGGTAVDSNGSFYIGAGNSIFVPSGRPIYFDGGGDTYIREATADNLQFIVGNTARVGITTAQLQLLGSTALAVGTGGITSTASISTNANIVAGVGSGNVAAIGTHPTYGGNYAAFWREGSDYAILTSSTNTFVNAPNGIIYFRIANGASEAEIRTDGLHVTAGFADLSKREWKHRIKPVIELLDPLEMLRRLDIVGYRMNEKPDIQRVGAIWEDTPDLFRSESGGIRWGDVTALNTAVLQVHETEIDRLKARVAALEQELAAWRS